MQCDGAIDHVLTRLTSTISSEDDLFAACGDARQYSDARIDRALIRLVGHTNETIAAAAAQALMSHGECVGILILRIMDGDRRAAAQLAQTHDSRAAQPLISMLRYQEWKRAAGALAMLGQPAVDPLVSSFRDGNTVYWREHLWPLKRIWQVSRRKLPIFLCSEHLTRCDTMNVGSTVPPWTHYVGCRICGRAWPLREVRELIVVLNRRSDSTEVADGQIVRMTWQPHKGLFDFDGIEIEHATDEDVERFDVRVRNDPDPFRRPRYRMMRCAVHSRCHLSENTLRILRSTFGPVVSVRGM